jgi:hypothetical protein
MEYINELKNDINNNNGCITNIVTPITQRKYIKFTNG